MLKPPDIPESDERKPDTGEPFRYVTPCCERQPYRSARMIVWKCSACGTLYSAKKNLYDKKTGAVVAEQKDPGQTGKHGI